MGEVLRELLPFAVIIAASPIVLIPMLLLLLDPAGRPAARAFLVACTAGIALVAVIATTASSTIERESSTSTWGAWVRIGLGAALLVLAIRKWFARGDDAPPPPWMARLADATPTTARRFGLVVTLANPKVLAVAVAAGVTIGQAGLETASTALATALFVTLSVSGIAGAFLVAALGGPAADARLAAVRRWLDHHRTAVGVGILVLLSALLIANGIAKLPG
jgi:threonine/homoserine/homoserine lactone efflux protein